MIIVLYILMRVTRKKREDHKLLYKDFIYYTNYSNVNQYYNTTNLCNAERTS